MRKIIGSAIGIVALFSAHTAVAAEAVTVDNFTRVETDYYFKARADAGCFGKLCNERGPKPVDDQPVIRLNRDTPYSNGVFDLTNPLTIIKPDTAKRFISHDIIVKQHGGSIEVHTQPGAFTEFRIILPRIAATIAKSGDRP